MVTGFIPEPTPSLTIDSRPIVTICLTALLELSSKTEVQPPGESPSGISIRFHVLEGWSRCETLGQVAAMKRANAAWRMLLTDISSFAVFLRRCFFEGSPNLLHTCQCRLRVAIPGSEPDYLDPGALVLCDRSIPPAGEGLGG